MLTRASTVSAEIQADYNHTVALQQEARRRHDVIMLNCINDKLVVMQPQMNIVETALKDLQTQTGDPAGALDRVVAAAAEVHAQREAGESCAGQRLLLTDSSNTFTHPDIPDDPGYNPFGPTLEPPAYASPIK